MNLSYRPMEMEDIDRIYSIEVSCFKTPWTRESFESEMSLNSLARYYVALNDDDLIVGYIGAWNIVGEGHITNVAVDPEFRGIGAGRLLVSAMIDELKKEDTIAITLEVRRSNEVAINLYSDFGFVEKGVREKYYTDNGEDAIIMWR